MARGEWQVADDVKRAFTLIEVLLVVAIIGVVTAVSTPYFVRSIRGNRLRVAARTVVMAGRYARSMAVLRQTELPLLDLDGDARRFAESYRVVLMSELGEVIVVPEAFEDRLRDLFGLCLGEFLIAVLVHTELGKGVNRIQFIDEEDHPKL